MNNSGPTLGSAEFTNDFLSREHLVPGGAKLDATQFRADDAVLVKLSANAAQGAVAIAFDALTGPVPAGTILWFGGAKFARTTAAAAAGAVGVAVNALPTALVDNDEAWYAGVGLKSVPAGTAVGRTIAERDASTGFGPADAADDEIFLTAFDVEDVDALDDVELIRHHTIIKENYLPGFSSLAAGVVTDLRALYTMTRGAE
jgi:hypothetical protein